MAFSEFVLRVFDGRGIWFMRKRPICAATLAIIALSLSPSEAGDLDPPGAPAPTPGPEPRIAVNDDNTPGDDSSHFRITEPGSYYLVDSLILLGNETKHGIVIEVSDVTVDLNGFTLDGYTFTTAPHMNLSLSGIAASGELENITVRNGVVRDFGEMGVRLFSASNTLIEGIVASDNGDRGIWGGDGGVVIRCVARGNLNTGIIADDGSTVTECAASENSGNGIYANPGGMVVNCTAADNDQHGIGLGSGSSAVNCNASRNESAGITAANGSIVRSCTVRSNMGNGIEAHTSNSLIVGNSCLWNGDGDDAGISISGTIATRNRVEGNTVNTLNTNVGIRVTTSGNLIIGNSATSYSIVGGNAVGPMLGFADPITSTNPWANFDF